MVGIRRVLAKEPNNRVANSGRGHEHRTYGCVTRSLKIHGVDSPHSTRTCRRVNNPKFSFWHFLFAFNLGRWGHNSAGYPAFTSRTALFPTRVPLARRPGKQPQNCRQTGPRTGPTRTLAQPAQRHRHDGNTTVVSLARSVAVFIRYSLRSTISSQESIFRPRLLPISLALTVTSNAFPAISPSARTLPSLLDSASHMTIDSQPHVSTLAQLESLQDRLLIDLEELEQRVERLLREAQRLTSLGKRPTSREIAPVQIASDSKGQSTGKQAA